MRRPLFPWLLLLAAVARAAPATAPKADLSDGFELVVAAAPPLVKHPIMGCLDDRGRLFVGDSAGLNWRPPQPEKELSHRVLVDPAGEEKTIPHVQIVATRLSPVSLMPPGLERTFTEQQLHDLVAWLGSLK